MVKRWFIYFLVKNILIFVFPNTPKAKVKDGMPTQDIIIFSIFELGPGVELIAREEII